MAIEPVAVYGLPDAWWQTYRSHLEAVGADDVLAAARELLDPERYLMLVVGDADKVRDELTATGLGVLELAAGE
jgi:hypothetical protein